MLISCHSKNGELIINDIGEYDLDGFKSKIEKLVKNDSITVNPTDSPVKYARKTVIINKNELHPQILAMQSEQQRKLSITHNDVEDLKESLKPSRSVNRAINNTNEHNFKKRENILKIFAKTLSLLGSKVKQENNKLRNKLNFNAKNIPVPVSMNPNILVENIKLQKATERRYSLKRELK